MEDTLTTTAPDNNIGRRPQRSTRYHLKKYDFRLRSKGDVYRHFSRWEGADNIDQRVDACHKDCLTTKPPCLYIMQEVRRV